MPAATIRTPTRRVRDLRSGSRSPGWYTGRSSSAARRRSAPARSAGRARVSIEQPPPQRAYTEPDRHVHEGDQETELPPFALTDVSGAEEDRRRAGAVVRHGGVEVREVRKRQRRHHRRHAARECGGEKRGIERGNVRGHAGERVMDVAIRRDYGGEHRGPLPS